MLLHNTERNRQAAKAPSAAQPPALTSMEAEREAVPARLSSLRRNTRLIGATTLIGASIVTAFVSFGLTPQYLATTTIPVDSRKTHILKDQEVMGRPGIANSAIESEAEMLASPSVFRRVAEQLRLEQDKEFTKAPAELSDWWSSSVRAAELANKIAESYLEDQVDGVAVIVVSEKTSHSAVKAALQETPGIEAKILGTVMNRVQGDFARSYPEYGSFHKVA